MLPLSLQDLMNIARTTLSSKILTQHKDFFAKLAMEAVERLKGSGNLEAIQVIKKLGGGLEDSYLEEGELLSSSYRVWHLLRLSFCPPSLPPSLFEGFLLEKKVGVNQPKRLENVRILIANTAMDTDKIKVEIIKTERSLHLISLFLSFPLPPSNHSF